MNKTVGPTRSALGMLEVPPIRRENSWHYKKIVEVLYMYHRLKSAAAAATISREMNPETGPV